LENRFHGVTTRAAIVLIMPPTLKLIFCGHTLARSYAGETKSATMSTSMVATANVNADTTSTQVLPIFATSSAGSVTASPNTLGVPVVTITETTTNALPGGCPGGAAYGQEVAVVFDLRRHELRRHLGLEVAGDPAAERRTWDGPAQFCPRNLPLPARPLVNGEG
jgi:hypothetical protein